MNGRMTVGFLIHHLDNDYSKSLLKGASEAARELGINLAIYPGRSLNCQLDNGKYAFYEYQNNVVYSYVSDKCLDAAVVSAGTVGSFVTPEEFKDFLDDYGSLPIVTTENKVEGYPCVRLSGSGIKEIVAHLVREHGKKHIAFVSGPGGNADAEERLAYYIEALGENGLEYDPGLVTYGKFSEYCVDLVGNLIDSHKEIDAICFANDMMCKGGYKAIESRGLRVGADIAVTGYDDSEVAVSMKPLLTTVRADAAKLGYRAVKEAVRIAEGGVPEDISLGSSPVYRYSCGCTKQPVTFSSLNISGEKSAECMVDSILSEYIPRYEKNINKYECIQRLREFALKIISYACGSDESNEKIFAKAYFARIFDDDIWKVVTPESVIRIVKKIRAAAISACSDEMTDRKISISGIMCVCLEITADRLVNLYYTKVSDITFTHFLISNITKDMTVYGDDEEKCYFSIVNNLYRAHMDSSYIYTYENPIFHLSKSLWRLPETVYLKAYHDGNKIAALTGESQKIPSGSIITNEYTPEDRCRIMIISPLFVNEEQYGVIVCETDNEYFPYIYSITPQICSAIKLTNLVARLESSLDAAQSRNDLLNRMSMCDELTGAYNRRGFYVYANRILKAPENEGRNAVILFGDLDNLKKINDTFGHDDGDYAIVQCADFIKSGLRSTDIVGRIGGDEFAAFAICDDTESIARLPSRIKDIAQLHNMHSNKPYNITVSIGIYSIICSPELNIQEFMDKADAALYEDKKKKNHDILKK